MQQLTIKHSVEYQDKALHSARPVKMVFKPAKANTGIIFKRVDLSNNNIIEANYKHITSTNLCSEIGNKDGAKVSTIEHLMAALFFLGIDNIIIEIDNIELPASDGSAYNFMQLLLQAGIIELPASKNILEVIKPVTVEVKGGRATLEPCDNFIIDATIDFAHSAIKTQQYTYYYNQHPNSVDIAKAKTFGFLKDAPKLHALGLGLGANVTNTNILTDDGVLEGCKLSYKQEFVKHKILDLCGDLFLSGMFIKGKVTAYKPSHASNHMLLSQLFSNKNNFRVLKNDAILWKYTHIKQTGIFSY